MPRAKVARARHNDVVRGHRIELRWVIVAIVVALVASGLVVNSLLRMTNPIADGSADSPTEVTMVTYTTIQTVQPTTVVTSAATPPTATTTRTVTSSVPVSTSEVTSTGASSSAPENPPPFSQQLPGSDAPVPIAWSGTAKVTVEVLGQCATSTPSIYRDVPADLALNLVQNVAEAADVPIPEATGLSEDLLFTLVVNALTVPSVVVYSGRVDDEDGSVYRYWKTSVAAERDTTVLHAELINQALDGTALNAVVDAETSLQSCESTGTVSLPRALGAGTTIDAVMTTEGVHLTLDGVTTDGKRHVTVEITATNK